MNRRGCVMFAVALSLILASCSPSAQTGVVPTAESSPRPNPVPTPTVYSNPKLAIRPLVFFGPLPQPLRSLDYMNQFAPDASWQEAASHVQVFNLYGGWVAHFPWEPEEASDAELQKIVEDVNRRGMGLGFEASPLVATDQCGRGIEGFFGPEEGLAIVKRLKQLGATVSYVTLDEPFAFGHIYDGEQACQWPAEKIAQEVKAYIDAIHSVYPDAIVGDAEPLWSGVDDKAIVEWLDAYKATTGSNLPFLHLDLDYSRGDWAEAAKRIEEAAHARGVEFGIFYTGDAWDATDAEWLDKALERAQTYELVAGGKPDHIKFQSWNNQPDYVLPESKPDTFTGFLNRYFEPRPVLSLKLGEAEADGSRAASGTLTNANGKALPEAEIKLSMKALDGPGVAAEYTVSGTVPAGVSKADAGFRLNTECGCKATNEITVYQMRYSEGGEEANRIVNSKFAQGMRGWGPWGSGIVRLEASDQGSGTMLHVTTTAEQDAAINSTAFNVTPGATYTFTVVAKVPPGAWGGGYFALMFLDPSSELARERIPVAPGEASLGTATTDAQGNYSLQVGALQGGQVLIQAKYAGTDAMWPAYASEGTGK